jgi:peptidyl-prolyl cis-trans isomerase B (cyclophilin B)
MVSCETKNKESIMDKYDGAVISTKFGDIVLEFFDDIAPKHVESFKLHAQNGYYNGTTFHRVIPGFMIQGGDPLTKSEDRGRHGTESEESTWDLPAEFSSTPHERGILSMARSQNPDSGGSQFFICVADAPFLDNKYTVFGKVVSGLDVVDAIVNTPRDAKDNPDDRIEMKVRLENKK